MPSPLCLEKLGKATALTAATCMTAAYCVCAGVAKALTAATCTTQVGTPTYMSPEVISAAPTDMMT
jgi:serine/threonine protein kinase